MDKLISQQAAIDKIKKRLFETAFNNVGIKQNVDETLVDVAENRLETWFDDVPSIQSEIIHCKDCKHWNTQLKTADGNGLGSCDFHNVNLVTSEGFCYWAERREDEID